MAQIEVTEESLRAAVDEAVFAQAVALADKVAGFSAVGPQIEAIVDGIEVSVRVKPFGLDARCACPAPYQDGAPCPHAVAAVLTWVRAGPDPAAGLRAELDDVLAGLAGEAADCDPDDGWYPDTSELEDLLDEVEDLAGQEPDAARELAGYVAARVTEVLAAGNCLTDDLADALSRAEQLRGDALPPSGGSRSSLSAVSGAITPETADISSALRTATSYTAGRSSVVRSRKPALARA